MFACVVDEISTIAEGSAARLERRREHGVSHAAVLSGVVEYETTDRLTGLPAELRTWLMGAAASPPPRTSFTVRSIERRSWTRTGAIEHRSTERFYIVPGVGAVRSPLPPPAARDGANFDRTAPLRFASATGAVLMHEIAGHRSEHSIARLPWPEWLTIHDRPSQPFDDAGVPAYACDLTRQPPRSLRRWRAIDTPSRRMWDVVVENSGAAPQPDRACEFVITAAAAGHWDSARDRVSLFITDAHLLRNGRREDVRLPVRLDFSTQGLMNRLAGATAQVVRGPAVICGAHGSDIPVGSASCDLLFDEGDD